MGRACSSGATEITLHLSSVSHLHTALLQKLNSASVSPLKVKKKIDLAPSLNFAKSRKEHRVDRHLWAEKLPNPPCTSFIEL